MEKQVNIVLPVYNRPEHTRQTLDSLLQNTDPKLYNLIVVDDNSDKETRDLLIEYELKYKFELFRNPENLGPGGSRNKAHKYLFYHGLRLRYIYQTDNDVYFKKGWLPKLIETYKKVHPGGIRLLGASCHPYQQNNSVLMAGGVTVGIKNAVSGYSSLYTWETWDQFGPFDTQDGLEKKTGRSDDWAFCQKIIQGGFLVGSMEPEMVIPCGKTDTYGDVAVGPETFQDHEGIMIK